MQCCGEPPSNLKYPECRVITILFIKSTSHQCICCISWIPFSFCLIAAFISLKFGGPASHRKYTALQAYSLKALFEERLGFCRFGYFNDQSWYEYKICFCPFMNVISFVVVIICERKNIVFLINLYSELQLAEVWRDL